MDQAIGGYFGFELQRGEHYHKNAIKLNTARNCLEYILRAKGYKKIYIPYYTCEVLLEPIQKCQVDYEFYSINEQLEPIKYFKLKDSEAFLYTNYFGLKDKFVKELAERYHNQLIIDNVQAFFTYPIKNIDTFYSTRKFFGTSDGAYLYTDTFFNKNLQKDISYNRVSHLLKRVDVSPELGYMDFVENDKSLIGQSIKEMSNFTDLILGNINYEISKQIRIENFKYLQKNLNSQNAFQFDNNIDGLVPMVYPFRTSNNTLRKKLIENKVYVASYWNNVLDWVDTYSLEYFLVKEIIPLPIDQRYTQKEMNHIIDLIKK